MSGHEPAINSTEFRVSLHPGQSAIFNSQARFKVVAAGRRFGKSHFAAVMLGIEALRSENAAGKRLTQEHGVYYIAPTFDQAKRVMWPKLRELLGYAQSGGFIANENVNDGWLQLINGRRIYIKGADNPDSLRGIALSYVVLDEYADMKANVWDEIIEPALMDVIGSALFIGTPKGKNHFFKLFMGALEKPPLRGEDGTLDTTYWDDWEAFHFKSTDNPFLSQNELKRQMNDPRKSREVIRQELEASFVSGGGKVLKPQNFEIVRMDRPGFIAKRDAVGNQVVASLGAGDVYITVDLAGFEKAEGNKVLRTDESVIVETLGVGETWYVLNVQHGHWDPRETALRIVRTAARYPSAKLGIEKGALMNAVGPYLEDYMREFGRYMTPTPLSHGGTKKADRISWALQGRSERGLIKLVEGPWNGWLLDQIADFPDPLSHDDGIDALAYVDQMFSTSYVSDADVAEWEPMDLDSGY